MGYRHVYGHLKLNHMAFYLKLSLSIFIYLAADGDQDNMISEGYKYDKARQSLVVIREC